jgi:hypothetical protein
MAVLDHRQWGGVAMSVDHINKALDELMWNVVKLDTTAIRRIRETWDAGDGNARKRAWVAVRDALKQSGREQLMDETRERVMRWQGDKPPLRGMFSALGLPKMEADLPQLKANAAPAVLDAGAVAIVGEFLTPEEREILEAPVRAREAL